MSDTLSSLRDALADRYDVKGAPFYVMPLVQGESRFQSLLRRLNFME